MCCGYFFKKCSTFFKKNDLTFFDQKILKFYLKLHFALYLFHYLQILISWIKRNQNFYSCKLFELKIDLYQKNLAIFLIFSHSFSAVWTSGREWCMWSNLFRNAVHAHACADFGSYAAVGCQVARWILTSSCQWFAATLSESTTRTGHHTSGLVGRRNRYVGGFGGAALSQKIIICMHLD